MKAAYYQGNKTFAIGPSEPVPPGPGEVRLHVAYCGVCGTDIHIFHGAMDKRVAIPQIIGHEASAIVAEVGEYVKPTYWLAHYKGQVIPPDPALTNSCPPPTDLWRLPSTGKIS